MCDYNMRWYPFDTEKCTMEMYSMESSVSFNPIFLDHSGPVELPQHFVKGMTMCPVIIRNKSGIVVEVFLGRPLKSTIISVFLPTTTFLILSQMVTVFGRDHLELVVEVNLTLMLVLATL